MGFLTGIVIRSFCESQRFIKGEVRQFPYESLLMGVGEYYCMFRN